MKLNEMGGLAIGVVRTGLFAAIAKELEAFDPLLFRRKGGDELYGNMQQRIVNGESVSDVLTTSLLCKGFTMDMLTVALARGYVICKLKFPEVSDLELLLQKEIIIQ